MKAKKCNYFENKIDYCDHKDTTAADKNIGQGK
jgi:hypothetical protein